MLILNNEQMKSLEDLSALLGIDHMRLMENAGSVAAKTIKSITPIHQKNVTILCGKGNNGGDACVVARKLVEEAKKICVVIASSLPGTKQAYAMFERIKNTDIEILQTDFDMNAIVSRINSADILIDGLFGTGFKGETTGKNAEIITLFNNAHRSKGGKYALDVPGGINSDTGACADVCIKADYTITFGAYKAGQFLSPARECCGKIFLADIAIPHQAYKMCKCTATITEQSDFLNNFPPRNIASNKGDFGKALLICGSKTMTGAAYLADLACLRSGAGITTLASTEWVISTLGSALVESTFLPLDANAQGMISSSSIAEILRRGENSQAILIGCGMGICTDTKELVYSLIQNSKVPMIIDADGINVLSSNINILKTAKAPIILTPHPGEMARLVGKTTEYVQCNRMNIAKEFATEYGVDLVLKGQGTVISSRKGEMHLSDKGNPGLAKGGSGDVLAGIITAFVAQGIETFNSANLGVYIHGCCADLCAEKMGYCGIIARDIIDMLPTVFKNLGR